MQQHGQQRPAPVKSTITAPTVTSGADAGQFAQTYRMRQGLASETLNSTVNACLQKYFQNLGGVSPAPGMYSKVIAQVEKPLIENVLRYVRGNQVRASHILGINRNTLRKKINLLDIDISDIVQE